MPSSHELAPRRSPLDHQKCGVSKYHLREVDLMGGGDCIPLFSVTCTQGKQHNLSGA